VEKSIKSKEHKVIADLIYQLRLAKGLKQSDLAQMLDEPQSFVSKIESGERRLDLVELLFILTKLDTSLLEFTNEMQKRLSEK
jgi:transcriptional regulator with XRE-family HTH domain